jgi:hypothetical protein
MCFKLSLYTAASGLNNIIENTILKPQRVIEVVNDIFGESFVNWCTSP